VSSVEYPNVPASIGAVVSTGKATLRDLDEHFGGRDLQDLIEIIQIDAHNSRARAKAAEKKK